MALFEFGILRLFSSAGLWGRGSFWQTLYHHTCSVIWALGNPVNSYFLTTPQTYQWCGPPSRRELGCKRPHWVLKVNLELFGLQ
jgi:hypothetical protein